MALKSIPEDKKIVVIFRMEPGSLGPDGRQYISEFCEFAQIQLQACAHPYIQWVIEPRLDKGLAEMEFQVASKKLSYERAQQYFLLFGEHLADFEEHLDTDLEEIINQYFGR